MPGIVARRWKALAGFAVLLLLIASAALVWYKLHYASAQPAWIATDQRSEFLYGSVGAENTAGIPYWIWLALPRIFPEYLPGPGGYAALGFPWEETREMPAGFSKKTVGYVRVAGNCAICHASSHPNGPGEAPTVFAAGPGHTIELERLHRFFRQCAQDPRFTANDILDEVGMATELSLADKLLYRFILIPRTRKQMLGGGPVMINATLQEHSRNPVADPALRRHLEDLEPDLNGAERDALGQYLHHVH